MILWIKWWNIVSELRTTCSRKRSFLWLAASLAGLCTRFDLLGVSSIVRSLGLDQRYYDRILDFFHSAALNTDKLARVWTQLVIRSFPGVLRINGRIVLLVDGIKVPKSGKKMPAVKLLHQESDNNTKPEYVMGHSCQAVSLVVGAEKSALAVPLASRIHEGLVFSNRCLKKLTDKMVSLVGMLGIIEPFYIVADAYYACRVMVLGTNKNNGHLITKVKSNAVAYETVRPAKKKRPGRPKKYGPKIKLRSLFVNPKKMNSVESPVYGEKNVVIRCCCVDLIWKPLGKIVRFVAVMHPTRGKCLLMSTDLSLDAVDIIRLYGIRFKIEVSFKNALRVVGAYAYHFWMRNMKPIKRKSGNQYLHRDSTKYRRSVIRKLNAYHRHVQVGLIAQGLLQYLSASFPSVVWKNFGSWLRTIRPGIPPSEMVTAQALRSCLPSFLIAANKDLAFTKFLLERIDINRSEGLRMTG